MPARVLRAASVLVYLTFGVTWAATFGTIVHIRGHVSDIALDESRGLLYAANFTANRIEVVSLATQSLQSPILLTPNPLDFAPLAFASLALSPDGRYLVVGQYANGINPPPPSPFPLIILDLVAKTRQTVNLGASVLSVAFGKSLRALVVTNNGVVLVDPVSLNIQVLTATDFDSQSLPVPWATFPPEIVRAATGVSGDGQVIYVLWDSFVSPAQSGVVRYEIATGKLLVLSASSSPPLGPRVISVDGTGSTFLGGWALFNFSRFKFHAPMVDLANFPYPFGSLNIGSHAYDWRRNTIYAQVPVAGTQPTAGTPTPAGAAPPELEIMDSDNLTVRERLQLKENLAGKSIISSDDQTMYSVSDSGVTVFPIGSLGQAHRVSASQEDVVFQTSGGICDRKVISHEIDIVSTGGGATDFTLSTTAAQGVVITPVSGTTPARVRIDVDSSVFHDQKGTVVVPLQISSVAGINIPPPVRLLINTRDPDQQGTIFNVPGKIVDVLADPVRNRFYVIRQDKNLVLIFDATSFKQIGSLRTGNTPVQMAMTRDWRYLIVGNDNSQIASVFDLQTLLPSQPIELPPGYYARSIAVSSRAILATSRSATPPAQVHQIDMNARVASAPDDLGIYINSINEDSALMASPSRGVIFMPMPDGTVALYEALADTFVASRKDLTSLAGAYAALSDDLFAVDTILFDSALVPVGKLNLAGTTSGITTVGGLGLISSIPPASVTGVMQRFTLGEFALTRPVRTAESPLVVQSLNTPTVGQIGQTILPFTRTLTPLANGQFFVMLSTSGFTAIPWRFDVPVITHPPKITAVTNAADQSTAVASGGLIFINGTNLSGSTASASQPPLATTLDGVCVEVNSIPIPLLQVSPTQVTAQVPFDVQGAANMIVENAGGVSPSFSFTVLSAAPAIFRTGTAGPQTGLPTVVLASDNSLVTLANPVHPRDWIVIYLTGLGTTSPQPNAGDASPFDPLAEVTQPVVVTLGRKLLQSNFAGLSPGLVGVYQINALVPFDIEEGIQVPLTITQGGQSTTILIRVVNP